MSKTVGVIGLGSIGLRHAKNLRALGHHVWGYDTDMSKRLELGFDYTSEPKYWTDVAGIVIATPTREHITDSIYPLQKGTPVFMEKPIANAMLSDLSKVLMVGYNQRFNSAVKQAKQWLDGGEIGTPIWGSFTCSQYNDKPAYLRDGGVILNWSHEIDLALYLLGDVELEDTQARVKVNAEGQDVMVDINMTHGGGIMSHVHLDYLTRPERRGFAIGGTKGWLSASLPDRTATIHRHEGVTTRYVDLEGSQDEDYVEEMRAFIDRIDGKTTIGCTGEEALKVLEICLEVRKQAGLP